MASQDSEPVSGAPDLLGDSDLFAVSTFRIRLAGAGSLKCGVGLRALWDLPLVSAVEQFPQNIAPLQPPPH